MNEELERVVALLREPLSPDVVSTRVGGKRRDGSEWHVPYLEGHVIIANANRIFGEFGWDSCLSELRHEAYDSSSGMYIAIGYVDVHVAGRDVRRWDIGRVSYDEQSRPGSRDMAVAGSFTDLLKRCFHYFGEQFGLPLYDKESDVFKAALSGGESQSQWGERGEQARPTAYTDDPASYVMPFGKEDIKGKTLAQIYQDNPGFLKWILSDRFEARGRAGSTVKDMVRAFMDRMEGTAAQDGAADPKVGSPASSAPATSPKVQQMQGALKEYAEKPVGQMPSKWQNAMIGELLWRTLRMSWQGYDVPADIRSDPGIWESGGVAKLNGHVTKWYKDGAVTIAGQPEQHIRELPGAQAVTFLNEVRERHNLLAVLPLLAEQQGAPSDAIAELITARYAEKLGRKEWRVWQKAIIDDLEPSMILDLAQHIRVTPAVFAEYQRVPEPDDKQLEEAIRKLSQ